MLGYVFQLCDGARLEGFFQQFAVVGIGERLPVGEYRFLQPCHLGVEGFELPIELVCRVGFFCLCRLDGCFGLFHFVAIAPQRYRHAERYAPQMFAGHVFAYIAHGKGGQILRFIERQLLFGEFHFAFHVA